MFRVLAVILEASLTNIIKDMELRNTDIYDLVKEMVKENDKSKKDPGTKHPESRTLWKKSNLRITGVKDRKETKANVKKIIKDNFF